MLADLPKGAMLLADKGYDANALRAAVSMQDAWANIPPKTNRKDPICFSAYLYKARQPDRAVLQQDKALSPHRDPLRQARRKLPRSTETRRRPHLATR
jgi:transposase